MECCLCNGDLWFCTFNIVCVCVLTERADIVELTSDTFLPIAGSSAVVGCLLAGDTVEIMCTHISYPVATVQFRKDGTEIVPDER